MDMAKSALIKLVYYMNCMYQRRYINQIKSNQIKSFIYHSPNSTAQIYICNYDNLLCDHNMDGGDCAAMLVSVGVVQDWE